MTRLYFQLGVGARVALQKRLGRGRANKAPPRPVYCFISCSSCPLQFCSFFCSEIGGKVNLTEQPTFS